jgi:hypothetical protein
VAALLDVTFTVPPSSDTEEEDRAVTEAQNSTVSRMNQLPCREKAGWLMDSLRAGADAKLPMGLQKEVNVEHQVGQLFVIKSQNHAVWEAMLRSQVDAQATTITLAVPGTAKVNVTAKVEFDWKKARVAAKAAQTERYEARQKDEKHVEGRKMHMTGNFKMSDSTDALSTYLQGKGAACKELTDGLWSRQAIERAEIAATGKGGVQRVGAYVVLSSKVEAELLMRMIQEKKVSWGGQTVSAFICRQWKGKETRKQAAVIDRRAKLTGGWKQDTTKPASTTTTTKSHSLDQRGAPTMTGDLASFPPLPTTASWGFNAQQQKHKKADKKGGGEGEPLAHHTRSEDEAKFARLEAAIAELSLRGEAQQKRIQEQATQLERAVASMEALTNELDRQSRTMAIWQEQHTTQLQRMADQALEQQQMFLGEFRALRAGLTAFERPSPFGLLAETHQRTIGAQDGMSQNTEAGSVMEEDLPESDGAASQDGTDGHTKKRRLAAAEDSSAGDGASAEILQGYTTTRSEGDSDEAAASNAMDAGRFGPDGEGNSAATATSTVGSSGTAQGITPLGYNHTPLPPQPTGQVEGQGH